MSRKCFIAYVLNENKALDGPGTIPFLLSRQPARPCFPEMPTHAEAVARAYCSSANLGPGYDTFGLALDQYYDVVKVRFARKASSRIRLRVTGRLGRGLSTEVGGN